VEISADLGDRVREGHVLARIEPAEEEERLEQARANLRIAEAALTQRRASLRIAETTASRTAALFEQNLVSRQQNDAVEADLEGARAQVQLAEAQVAQVRSALSSAEVELAATRVVAPFDGVVGRRYLDRGAFAAANAPVMSVVDLSTIKTTIALPERDAPFVAVGQPATVRVGSLPGVDFAGRVARVGAIFDPDSATTRAEVEVENAEGRLKPGMFATVTIALDDESEALLVPQAAVLEEEGRSWVFVVNEKHGDEAAVAADEPTSPGLVAQRTEVHTLGTALDPDVPEENGGSGDPARAGWVAVDGSLEAGERVITLGHESLADGAAVRIADGKTPGGDDAAPEVAE
jgi:RND family efflux transporter MFP subunit